MRIGFSGHGGQRLATVNGTAGRFAGARAGTPGFGSLRRVLDHRRSGDSQAACKIPGARDPLLPGRQIARAGRLRAALAQKLCFGSARPSPRAAAKRPGAARLFVVYRTRPGPALSRPAGPGSGWTRPVDRAPGCAGSIRPIAGRAGNRSGGISGADHDLHALHDRGRHLLDPRPCRCRRLGGACSWPRDSGGTGRAIGDGAWPGARRSFCRASGQGPNVSTSVNADPMPARGQAYMAWRWGALECGGLVQLAAAVHNRAAHGSLALVPLANRSAPLRTQNEDHLDPRLP
jgi:hypothetical protein